MLSAASKSRMRPGYAESIPSDADTRASSIEAVSDAATSESGYSDAIGETAELRANMRRKVTTRRGAPAAATSALHRLEDPLAGATATCSMCEADASEFLCVQCGRLSFCSRCCLNLHDNKFLGQHRMLSLDLLSEGEERTLEDVKALRRRQDDDEKARRDALTAVGGRSGGATFSEAPEEGTPSRGRAGADRRGPVAGTAAALDQVAITADRSVINVRSKELTACLTMGRGLHADLARERTAARETAATAVEAVRRRFDVLRQLINDKEAAFVSVVESVGKERFDLATSATCSCAIAVAELEGFVSHLQQQMDRLEGNLVEFNEQRGHLMRVTEQRLGEVDGWTHDHQTKLEAIRNMSLGAPVAIDSVAEAIQSIAVPQVLIHRAQQSQRSGIMAVDSTTITVEMASPPREHADVVSKQKFLASPGVRVIRQQDVVVRPQQQQQQQPAEGSVLMKSASMNQSAVNQSAGAVGGRRLFREDLDTLRRTPMQEVLRTSSPMLRKADSPVRQPTTATASVLQRAAPASAEVRSNTPTRAGFSRLGSDGGGAPRSAAPAVARRLASNPIATTASAPAPQPLPRQSSSARTTPTRVSTAQKPTASFLSSSRNTSPIRRPLPGDPLIRRAASPVHRGVTDNPGPGSYTLPSSFSRGKSPVRSAR